MKLSSPMRLEDLPLHLALAVGAGDVEDDAGEAGLLVAEAAGFLPAEDVGEERELVRRSSRRPC